MINYNQAFLTQLSLDNSGSFSPTIIININPQQNPTAFKEEAIQQIAPELTAKLTAAAADLVQDLSGPNRLQNVGKIIEDILVLIPSLANLDVTSVVAIEIGIAEGVIAIVLPLIPGGAPYLPIAMALAPFAVKAINLAAEGLFELGKVMIHKIEQKTTSEMIAILQ